MTVNSKISLDPACDSHFQKGVSGLSPVLHIVVPLIPHVNSVKHVNSLNNVNSENSVTVSTVSTVSIILLDPCVRQSIRKYSWTTACDSNLNILLDTHV